MCAPVFTAVCLQLCTYSVYVRSSVSFFVLFFYLLISCVIVCTYVRKHMCSPAYVQCTYVCMYILTTSDTVCLPFALYIDCQEEVSGNFQSLQ